MTVQKNDQNFRVKRHEILKNCAKSAKSKGYAWRITPNALSLGLSVSAAEFMRPNIFSSSVPRSSFLEYSKNNYENL